MANTFDNVRLPEDIERGTVGGPSYNTQVIRLASGGERRNQEWEKPLDRYNIGYGIGDRGDLMEDVYSFFHARGGKARAFRFRNWLDYRVVQGPVGIVADEPLQRQLIRVYEDEANTQIRIITLPVPDTLKVFKNSVLTNDYTVEGGLLTFGIDPGVNVLATFEFDMRVRFDTDDLQVKLNTWKEGQIPLIQLIETRN